MIRFASLLMASIVATGAAMTTAKAADLVAVPFETPGICGTDKVLNRIVNRFAYQVRHVPNLPQVGIVDFQQIRENRFQPQAYASPIERRYCQARATLSDGHTRDVWYLIEKPMGFAGFGSNVEFCVSGFDRWNVYGGRCRVLR